MESGNKMNMEDDHKSPEKFNSLKGNKKSIPPSQTAIPKNTVSTVEKKPVSDKESVVGAASELENEDVRGKWSNQIEFFLSCLAFAVGIGNVWRFPYKCYKNGGGVFLIPYFICLFVAALPLFFMELALGQFGQLGPNKIFGKLAPLLRGLGYGMLCITGYIVVYYNVIIAWCIYYTFAGFTSVLEWESCDNSYNTPDCFSPEFDDICEEASRYPGGISTWWNYTCIPVDQFCQMYPNMSGFNQTHCYQNSTDKFASISTLNNRVSPAEEYFRRNMLQMESDTSLDNLGHMNFKLVGCLFLSWLIVMACLIKGVKSAGKVVWFTALFPYAVLLILLVRGVTLPGAMGGIHFFLVPKWEKLKDISVWADAATQIFYSLSPAFGGLITLASYNQRNTNCQRDAIIIAIANSATSIFAGIVIFSILGHMAHEFGVDVSEVVEGGTSLAFIAYPTAIKNLPISPFWSFLFFTMLLTLGLDSQFTMVETIITAIYDEFPKLREKSFLVVGGVTMTGFLLGLPLCLQGGYYLFVLMDWYSGAWSLISVAIIELVVISWVYGLDSFFEDIESMGIHQNWLTKAYWSICWKYISPVLLFSVLIFTLADYKPARDGDYIFPLWANIGGWWIAISSVAIIIPFGLYELYKGKKDKLSLQKMLECDYVWRNESRNLCTMASKKEMGFQNAAFENVD